MDEGPAGGGGGDLINVIKDPMFDISQVLSTAVFLLGLQ